MELWVGGNYRLSKRLGSGAFGDVFLGTNIKTGENVAVKLVGPSSCLGTLVGEIPLVSVWSQVVQNVLWSAWHSKGALVRGWGRLQCNGSGSTWALSWRSILLLQTKVQPEDSLNGGWPVNSTNSVSSFERVHPSRHQAWQLLDGIR